MKRILATGGFLLVLSACATHPEPMPVAETPPPAAERPPKSVLLEASRTHLAKHQFTVEVALTNETDVTMIVRPKDITCQRGDTHGKPSSVFHRTNRDIELFPNRMVRFQLVCKTGNAQGNLAVNIPRAYPRTGRGRKLGSEVSIAAEWSYYAEDGGNRAVSSTPE